jgi:hypothetical protein
MLDLFSGGKGWSKLRLRAFLSDEPGAGVSQKLMNATTGMLLIVVALLVLYGAVTGKYAAFEHFFQELFGLPVTGAAPAGSAGLPGATVGGQTGGGLQSEQDRLRQVIQQAQQTANPLRPPAGGF